MLYNCHVSPHTNNLYGRIIITNKAIQHVVLATARECYGISTAKKVKVGVFGNHIKVSVNLLLKFGVTIDPVIESVRRAIKYNVETFTGMTVDCVNIDVLGIGN